MNKLMDEILDEVFPIDITEIINQQEYLGMRLSGGIDSAFLCFCSLWRYSGYRNSSYFPENNYAKDLRKNNF